MQTLQDLDAEDEALNKYKDQLLGNTKDVKGGSLTNCRSSHTGELNGASGGLFLGVNMTVSKLFTFSFFKFITVVDTQCDTDARL